MNAVLAESQILRANRFYSSTIGKKAVMAVTGVVLFGFVVGHLLGNLQIYAGPEQLNAYAAKLAAMPGLVWAARLVLLACLILHVAASVQLARLRSEARPVGYRRKKNIVSSYASRTMMWSGPIIFVFVVYHLLHFTTGQAHPTYPNFEKHDVYRNVVEGFRRAPVSIAYSIAMVLLAMHLFHGLWSMFQSLGFSHPRYTPLLRRGALAFAILIGAGNISIPLAVLLGIVR